MEENKQENKELQDAELGNVAGGTVIARGDTTKCKNCGEIFEVNDDNSRMTGSCFSRRCEYQCPKCGNWN